MTAESPEMLDDADPVEVARAAELCVREDNYQRLEDAAMFLTAFARRQQQAQRGGSDE